MHHPLFSLVPFLVLLLFHHDETAIAVEAATATTVASFMTPTTTTTTTTTRRHSQYHEKSTTCYCYSSSRIVDDSSIPQQLRANKSSLAFNHKFNTRFTTVSSLSYSSSSTRLFLSSNNSNNKNNNNQDKNILLLNKSSSSSLSSSSRERGIYARPSAAIERGSGFFIPGLEGSRIRLLFGILVVVLVVTNHYFSFSFSVVADDDGEVVLGSSNSQGVAVGVEYAGMVIAELISAFYGAMLILQGSIDFGVEMSSSSSSSNRGVVSGLNKEEGIEAAGVFGGEKLRSKNGYYGIKASGKSEQEISDDNDDNDDEVALKDDAMQRISRSLVAYTPATEVRLVSEEYGVLYSFGITYSDSDVIGMTTTIRNEEYSKDQKQLIKLCLDAVSSSRGGSRVALPPNHPSSKLLPMEATRCVLIQKVDDYRDSRTCIIVGSDKLLPSFTKNDLRWLGQLAQYYNLYWLHNNMGLKS